MQNDFLFMQPFAAPQPFTFTSPAAKAQADAAPPFPPHFPNRDLPERLAQVWVEWRRDNGLFGLTLLESILEDYPWSREAADMYGLIHSKVHHTFSLRATLRLHEWFALHQQIKFAPYQVTEGVWRIRTQMEVLREWLAPRTAEKGSDQWANLVDIGGQQGEVCNRFIGIPGIKLGVVVEAALTNCEEGEKFYRDARQVYVNSIGGGFGLQLPIKTDSMDVAVLSGVLEHVLEPDVMVAEAERVTRAGGLIIIQVPYGGMEGGQVNPGADILSFRGHVRSIDPYHYLKGRQVVAIHYQSETNNPASPHTWYGEVGDWVVAYESPEK
jgi:SAM-dependent methyltransferase